MKPPGSAGSLLSIQAQMVANFTASSDRAESIPIPNLNSAECGEMQDGDDDNVSGTADGPDCFTCGLEPLHIRCEHASSARTETKALSLVFCVCGVRRLAFRSAKQGMDWAVAKAANIGHK